MEYMARRRALYMSTSSSDGSAAAPAPRPPVTVVARSPRLRTSSNLSMCVSGPAVLDTGGTGVGVFGTGAAEEEEAAAVAAEEEEAVAAAVAAVAAAVFALAALADPDGRSNPNNHVNSRIIMLIAFAAAFAAILPTLELAASPLAASAAGLAPAFAAVM